MRSGPAGQLKFTSACPTAGCLAGLGRLRFSGFAAWLAWVFVHIAYLIEFDNKLRVLFRWGWNYLTRKRGAHLITGPDPFPIIHPSSQDDPKPQKWNPTK